jgi:hypothetical protein
MSSKTDSKLQGYLARHSTPTILPFYLRAGPIIGRARFRAGETIPATFKRARAFIGVPF